MTPRELETCATCDAYRRMAEEWRARLAAVQATPAAAFEAGFRASGLSLTVYRPMMEAHRAAFLERKADRMPLSLAAVLLVLALVFVVLAAVRPFPLWPAVLCVILERLIALGWRAVVLVAVLLFGSSACAATVGVAVDGGHGRRLCPDGRPVRILEDPACGHACGYSCLPDRWAVR